MNPPLLFQTIISAAALYMLVRAACMRIAFFIRYFLLMALCVFLYSAGYLFELDAYTLEGAYFALRFQYYGVSFFPVFFYLFVREYGGRPVQNPWILSLMFLLPVAVLVSANAYPDFTFYFQNLSFSRSPMAHIMVTPGPLFHLFTGFCLLSYILSVSEVRRRYPKATRDQRSVQRAFILAALFPALSTGALPFKGLNAPFSLIPFTLVLSLLLFGYYLLHFRARDWAPYAKEHIVKSLSDGFILLDPQGRFLEANEAAYTFFPELKTLEHGQTISAAETIDLSELKNGAEATEVTVKASGGQYCLRASKNAVRYQNRVVCICILLYDVTELLCALEELTIIASTDALTGLLTRREFFRVCTRDIALHIRTRQEAALLMLDIDHFKQVNDRFGHIKGDEVLAGVAQAVNARLRHTDFAGRYGGEEFCIFLPATTQAGAMVIAEEIRSAVQALTFFSEGGTFSVTVSIGVAPLEGARHKEAEDLIKDADVALYAAKHGGRNRSVMWEEPQYQVF